MTRPPEPLTINGFDGVTKPTEELFFGPIRRRLAENFTREELAAWHAAGDYNRRETNPAISDMIHDAHLEVSASILVAEYHNRLATLLHTYLQAASRARTALTEVNNTYDDLGRRTTTAWHAAHHRYMTAITEAQAALAEKIQAAGLLSAHHHGPGWHGMVQDYYDRLVPAEHRANVPDLTNVDAELTEFTETNRGRIQLLSYTLTGVVPPGFTPEDIPTGDAAEDEDDQAAYGALLRRRR